jgi:hypothetical protein
MGSNGLGGASMEALVGALVELDRELTDDSASRSAATRAKR